MWFKRLSLISLLVLIVLELALQYDTFARQLALASTNILLVLLYWGVSRYLRQHSVVLPNWIWFLVAWGIWLDAIGNFAGLYARFTWWDQFVHFFNPITITVVFFFIFEGFRASRQYDLPKYWHYYVVISGAMFISVLYELTEYLGDILFDTHRITNLLDTVDDLWWALLASIIVVLILGQKSRKKLTDS
ncbi:MAG: hypothetical protein V1838_01695 [Patescibacteria group bacterium]